MGKAVKYELKLTGEVFPENHVIGRWADGSYMTVKEMVNQHPEDWIVIEENVITDQEREEIFDFAKELMRSALLGHGGITPEQAIIYAKELYRLKDTI